MATIVAVDCTDGVLLAGDRVVVRGKTVAGSRRHVFAFDATGTRISAAAVGDDPDAFRRRLDVALRGYASDRSEPTIEAVSRMASEAATAARVEALVAARDESGTARVRSVSDGVLDERVAALGSANSVVLGPLEAAGELDLDDAEATVREAFRAAAERDPGTGEAIDVFRLPDAETGKTL